MKRLVMEYLAGGSIQWQSEWKEPLLSLPQTRRIMKDAILGLEYRKLSELLLHDK